MRLVPLATQAPFALMLLTAFGLYGCSKKESDDSDSDDCPVTQEGAALLEDAAAANEGCPQGGVHGGKQPGGNDGGGTVGDDSGDDSGDDTSDTSDDSGDDASDTSDDTEDDSDDSDDSDGGTVVEDIKLTVDYRIRRYIFTADEEATATVPVYFAHNGTSVTCSSDGGATYGACTSSNSFAWTVANRANEHKIKVVKTGAANSPQIFSFTPQNDFVNLEVVTCTQNVTADEDFDALNARFTGGEVVCLGDGVTISNDDTLNQGSLKLHTNDVLIARQGHVATVQSSRSSGHVFEWWLFPDGDVTKVVGLNVDYTGGFFGARPFYITWTTAVTINDCTITVTSDAAAVIGVEESSGVMLTGNTIQADNSNTEGISVSHDSMVDAYNNDVHTVGSAVAVSQSGQLNISHSVLESLLAQPVFVSGGTPSTILNTERLRIVNRWVDPTSSAVFVDSSSGEATVYLYNLQIFTDAGGIAMSGDNTASTVMLDDVTIAHMASGQTDDAAILVGYTGGYGGLLLSQANEVRVCHQAPGTHTFDRFLDDSVGNAQTFDVSAQLNGGVIATCPAWIDFP